MLHCTLEFDCKWRIHHQIENQTEMRYCPYHEYSRFLSILYIRILHITRLDLRRHQVDCGRDAFAMYVVLRVANIRCEVGQYELTNIQFKATQSWVRAEWSLPSRAAQSLTSP